MTEFAASTITQPVTVHECPRLIASVHGSGNKLAFCLLLWYATVYEQRPTRDQLPEERERRTAPATDGPVCAIGRNARATRDRPGSDRRVGAAGIQRSTVLRQ